MGFALFGYLLVLCRLRRLLVISSSVELCPISKVIRQIDNLLPYPDIYVPDEFIRSHKGKIYNCTSFGVKDPLVELGFSKRNITNVHHCLDGYCPITARNVDVASSVPSWVVDNHAICNMSISASRNSTLHRMNVIVVGGSMTAGAHVMGYCCISRVYNTRCLGHSDQRPLKDQFTKHYNTCNWFNYLSKWLQHTYKHVDFSFYNLALSGYTSSMMAAEISGKLTMMNIIISQSDLILLDHSCNDQLQVPMIMSGMELLMREIIRASVDASPTFLIIEQYMHTSYKYTGYHISRGNPTAGYVGPYRNISALYNTMYFSYNEVVWDTKGAISNKQLELYELLRSYDLHSSWHAHKYISELLADYLIKHIHEECKPHKSLKILHDKNYLNPAYSTLVTQLESTQCITTIPMVLDRYPVTTFVPTNVTQYELELNGWTEYMDHHHVAGWIINNHAPLHHRVLNFSIWNNKMDIYAKSYSLLLYIQYLKTYHDAGRVGVYICGKKLVQLDALWQDNPDAKISIPQIYKYVLSITDLMECMKIPIELRVLSIIYGDKVSTTDNKTRRWNHKFKLLHVKACFIS